MMMIDVDIIIISSFQEKILLVIITKDFDDIASLAS